MTATQLRPSGGPSEGPAGRPSEPAVDSGRDRRRNERSGRGARPGQQTAVRRTLLALLASMLGIVPLKGLLSDNAWLFDVWFSMIIVIAPAALLRRRRAPGALDIWPGIVILVPWLTLRFLHDSAAGGIIPTGQTWSALSGLLTQLHETSRDEVAPIHSTVAVRLVLCALAGLFAALVDLIAVVGRRSALAGVPLLVVFTVSGAVPRDPVAWTWFVFAAVGFLVLLALDSGDTHERWGRRVRAGGSRAPAGGRGAGAGGAARTTRSAVGISGPRIAVIAVIAAIVLPLAMPGEPRNLLANAFHGGGGDGTSLGGEGRNSGRISPFAALRGQLNSVETRKLADVQLLGPKSDVDPYYLRENVLTEYSDRGWRVASHGPRLPTAGGVNFPIDADGSPPYANLRARIDVSGLRGNPVSFNYPVRVDGLPDDTTWSAQDQLLLGSSLNDDTDYTVTFRQPNPSVQQLRTAGSDIDPLVGPQLDLPADIPGYARSLATRITAGKQTPYDKARAISDYFGPENGFVYDLSTGASDSGSALVSFLQKKRGYCQQYAAAMGVLLRLSGVPSRVVLGYLNSGPDKSGHFTVSTTDAHAWVEAWFQGIGWVPFDPTPASGLPGGGGSLAWAPRDNPKSDPGASTAPTPRLSPSRAPTTAAPSTGASSSAAPLAGGGSSSSPTPWIVLAVVVVVLLVLLAPAAVRAARRRRRYLAARHGGDAEALWAELADTAQDLGLGWSGARTPRQVVDWLAAQGTMADSGATSGTRGGLGALGALADAVEHRRYAGPAGGAGSLPRGASAALRDVVRTLRERRSRVTRFRAVFWPASLGWTSSRGHHEL